MIMEMFKNWVISVAAVTVILGMVDMIVPKGRTKKTVTIVSGFILMAFLIQPLFNIVGALTPEKFLDMDAYELNDKRVQIQGNSSLYDEENLIIISNSYKDKLSEYIIKKAELIEGVKQAKCNVVINEDYTDQEYGTIDRIYLEVYKGSQETDNGERTPGLGKVKRIENIEISLDGIKISRSDKEIPVEEEDEALVSAIEEKIVESLEISKNVIQIEMKN